MSPSRARIDAFCGAVSRSGGITGRPIISRIATDRGPAGNRRHLGGHVLRPPNGVSKTVALMGRPPALLRQAMSLSSQIARQHRLMEPPERSERGGLLGQPRNG